MNALPMAVDCWNRIGVRGDRSCGELAKVGHCHNCPVFSTAGRRFLDAPSPDGYLEEWTRRLAAPIEEAATDLAGVLVFRVGEEWLALTVGVLVEVTTPRPVHRVPHRGGVLAGLVNIRGELHLCVHLDQVLGIRRLPNVEPARLLVVQREADRWVFPVDEVDQVQRVPMGDLTPVPPTVGRALGHLTRGVFRRQRGPVGLLNDGRLMEALRARMR